MDNFENKILQGDTLEVLKRMPAGIIDCVITSPPYWGLRDYGVVGQLGLEETPDEYVSRLCDMFDEIGRVLKSTGTVWVNLGDTYSHKAASAMQGKNGERATRRFTSHGFKTNGGQDKSLCQIPARFAIEMAARGWILRNEIIWHKPNCMPSSVKDRFTVDFEKVFFFVKNKKYHFEQQKEKAKWGNDPRAGKGRLHYEGKKRDGKNGQGQENFAHIVDMRNKRAVWSVSVARSKDAHFAVFPENLINPMIEAGCPRGGVVLDPFIGSGTTAVAAMKLERKYLGIELNPEYIKIAEKRIMKSK